MKITVDVSEELVFKIDREAQNDGHSNRNAVIRKVLQLFFGHKPNFTEPEKKRNKTEGTDR